MNNRYTISSEDGKLLIKTTLNPNEMNKRLNQIAKQFHQSKLTITDYENKSIVFNYSKASDIREQLETLIVQNFKDAWEESKAEHIRELKETGEEEAYILNIDWTDAKEDYLKDYFWNLETLIKQESGLFK